MSKSRFSILALITALAVVIIGAGACSSSDDGNANTSPSPEAGTSGASQTIGPEGGTLVTSFGLTIDVPAGAVDTPTTFTAQVVTDAPPPFPGTQEIGGTYKLGPQGTTFKKPIKVTLALPAGSPTKDIVLVRLPEGQTEWLPIAGLGAGASAVVGYTRSFSWFRTVQMLFEQAGCFIPTSCTMSCLNETSCTGSCVVQGTKIKAGAVCSPDGKGISCICDAADTGLTPIQPNPILIDAADPLDWAVALYQIGTRCGWPCSTAATGDAGSDAAVDAGPPLLDGGNPFLDAGFICSSPLVISKVYVAGGTATAYPNNDFVELHNRDAMPINLSGFALQLNDATALGAWSVVPLSGTIAGGGFYLVALGGDAAFAGIALPTPDATGTFNLPRGSQVGAGGRVAITASTTPLTGAGPWAFLDGVTYKPSTLTLEGTATSASPNSGALLQRGASGCTDTDNNATDVINFNYQTPNNSATAPAVCTCP